MMHYTSISSEEIWMDVDLGFRRVLVRMDADLFRQKDRVQEILIVVECLEWGLFQWRRTAAEKFGSIFAQMIKFC